MIPKPLACHIEVDLCHNIAEALAYIHSKEMVHCNLSGNNVPLLTGRAKITDFRISKLLVANRRMTPLTMCHGTWSTCHQRHSENLLSTPRKSTAFSFGVLQIQIMTRQFPDPGPPKRAVEDSRSQCMFLTVNVVNPQPHQPHSHIALGCLSYLEKDRPSAQDLCQQLAAIKEAPCYLVAANSTAGASNQGPTTAG